MLAALLGALLYLALCAHILVDIRLDVNGREHRFQTRLRFWGIPLNLSMPKPKRPGKRELNAFRRCKPLFIAGLRTLRVGQLDLHAHIGLDDAAATALLCGAIFSAGNALTALAGHRTRSDIRVDADYRTPCFTLYARCIFSLIPGDIMFAVAKAAVNMTRKEGFKWLSTPSRA